MVPRYLSPPQQPEIFELDGSPVNSGVFELDRIPVPELDGQEISWIVPSPHLYRPMTNVRDDWENDEEVLHFQTIPDNNDETSLLGDHIHDQELHEDRQAQGYNSVNDDGIPFEYTSTQQPIDVNEAAYAVEFAPLDARLGAGLDSVTGIPNAPFPEASEPHDTKKTSYYFPDDPDPPNWRSVVLRIPYLLTLASISLGLAATQEYLLYRSRQRNRLIEFRSLNDISVPVYFLWRYFPTMIMVLYGVAYQMVDVEAKRLEPYYRLAQRSGATVSESLNVDGTNFWTWFRPPFPGSARTRLSTIISFLAVAIVPVIQNATLSVKPGPGGAFTLHVESGWSRSLTAILGFVGISTVALIYPLRHRTGLSFDPGGISSLLGMCTKSHILLDFGSLDVRSSDKEIGRHLSHRRYILHKSCLWQGEYIRKPDGISSEPEAPLQDHPFTLPLSQGLPAFIFILVVLALVPILLFTPANIVLDKLPFLMTALGITVKLLWTLFDTNVRLTEPYYHLVRRYASPNVLTVDYTGTVSFALPFKALKERHHTLALVGINSILLDVLTVCLSSFSAKGAHFMHRKSTAPADNILEGDAETFRSFWISLILSVLVLFSLCATAVFVYAQRSDVSLPRKPGSLAFVLLVTHQSKAMVSFVDVEKLSSGQKRRHLRKIGKTYGFGWFSGRDGNDHLGIDEEPLLYSYKNGQNPKYSVVRGDEIGGWEHY